MLEALTKYLVAAMLAWSPAVFMPGKDVSHYEGTARDVAEVVLEETEKPLFAPTTAGADRAKTALLLVALAYKESSFWPSIGDGTCNGKHPELKEALRLLAAAGMTCDGGHAFTFWQIQPGKGLWLTGDFYTSMGGTGPAITGDDLLADRKLAARTALHIARSSFHATKTLCGYSGERYDEKKDGDHGCRLAWEREKLARDWWKEHPFVPPSADDKVL